MTMPAAPAAGEVNIHATAIVVGQRGLLFTGPSGSGKSMLAFACMVAARRAGAPAALIADDQVFVSCCGDRIVARRPDTIAGLIELRGSGIVEVESVPEAALDLAISVISLPESERLPPANEKFTVAGIGELPMIRIWRNAPEPLAFIAALFPRFRSEIPFRSMLT